LMGDDTAVFPFVWALVIPLKRDNEKGPEHETEHNPKKAVSRFVATHSTFLPSGRDRLGPDYCLNCTQQSGKKTGGSVWSVYQWVWRGEKESA
jgi:hypothetical protein